ncbi:hypothetical protein ZIOFF_036329 [Zingiber officinale]|uniref:PPC domain-containing protein n=2 Tax=Zingiber officinale TaxID=94328 RepID=A0A8J5GE77_ZINOF|nr:hypothetical protein ZIOFF_036329 [Zingiber officinale]
MRLHDQSLLPLWPIYDSSPTTLLVLFHHLVIRAGPNLTFHVHRHRFRFLNWRCSLRAPSLFRLLRGLRRLIFRRFDALMSEFVRAPGAMIGLSQPASDDDGEGASRQRAIVLVEPASGGSSSGRKPRGRPPGSKNKPKPPVVITKASESAMQPVVLELAGGSDVVSGVSDFAHRRGVGVSVLGGSGAVADVTLRHPSSAHGGPSTIAVPGRFDILSFSGTLLPPPAAALPPGAPRPPPLTVSLAGPHGQVIGGAVAGPMTAVGPVLLVAATFAKPEFHRLPVSDDDEEAAAAKEEDQKPGVSEAMATHADPNALPPPLSHADVVLWAQPSTARPPPHAHPPPPHY